MKKGQINIKKYISRILKIAVLVAGAVVIYVGLDYLISDDTNEKTTRNRINYHDFYEEDEVDTIFIGPSHSIMLIDANKLTEDLDESVFNLASTNQYITGSYAILKDACENKNITKVYMEVSPSRFCKKTSEITPTTIITDYTKSLFPKLELITEMHDSDKYIPVALRLRRNLDPIDLITVEDLKEIHSKKSQEKYINYETSENYLGRGQWVKHGSLAVTNDNTAALNINSRVLSNYKPDEIEDLQLNAFKNIISYCKNNNIQLTFYVAPYNAYYMSRYTNYEEFMGYIKNIAEENDVTFWDFNYAKSEYLDLKLGDFVDFEHVNIKPVDMFTSLLEMCMKNPDGDYFCDSLEEKYPETSDVYAVGFTRQFITENGEYEKEDNAKGEITDLKVDISAIASSDTPALAKVYELEVENDDPDEFKYTVVGTMNGEQTDEYTTEFTLPFDDFETYYKVELVDPDDGTVLYETITDFDME